MLHPVQLELNHIADRIRESACKFPDTHPLAEKYLLILKISDSQRKRKLHNVPQTLSHLETLKTGHRQAEQFLLEIDVPGAKPQPILREIKNILNLIALEFHAEIVAIESRHPEMKAEFAREREAHRIRWNDYLESTQHKD